MLPESVKQALDGLAASLATTPTARIALHARWRGAAHVPRNWLSEQDHAHMDMLDRALPQLTRTVNGSNDLGKLFGTPSGEVLFTYCASNASHADARFAKLLAIALEIPDFRASTISAARDRVIQGPMVDALCCMPLLGTGDRLLVAENAEAKARSELLLWEAGASAIEVPELGAWLFGSEATFEAMVAQPARGSLRGRVLAARCLELCARGIPADTDPEIVGKTLQVLQPLILHPEPLVWIHAARSLGRLTGVLEQLEGTLLDWIRGSSQVLRQRAMTAFASLPGERMKLLGHELVAMLESKEDEHWVLSAAAAATPYLFHERRETWDLLAEKVLAGGGGSIAARALARGLASLYRRGNQLSSVEGPMRRLRRLARSVKTDSFDDLRRWLEVIAVTDPIDGAERDPLDLELGLENLVRIAAQYDDEEADARAARIAEALGPTFQEAKRIVLGTGSVRHRAAAMNAFEGCGRSLALRLWGPQLITRPAGDPIEEPDLTATWEQLAKVPAELIEAVKEWRKNEGMEEEICLAVEVLALRLGGYALDAVGEEPDFGRGRGPTSHDTCLWLRKMDGLGEGSRELSPHLRNALSAMFWRLVDGTRGTALGEVDDVEWLGPFAAWWALVIDRPAMLQQLATALPMIADGALETCCTLSDRMRSAIAGGDPEGQWGVVAEESMRDLKADHTELAAALRDLSAALAEFSTAAGPRPDLESLCLRLVLAAERLQTALADPVKALRKPLEKPEEDTFQRALTENAPRVAGLVARAIRSRELSMLDVWFTALGPIASALVEAAVDAAVKKTPPPPPKPKKVEPAYIEGYELVKPLGEGGIGSVWLVRKKGAERLFVLKIPKADALAGASETERKGILDSFVEEANALAGLYHPNVANIIDRGVWDDMPYLVLEYLIGADLKQYSNARLMSFFELRQVVLEACAGLAALHNAGLVHRDIKPANLWLRMPLAGGERFDGPKHRDPARVPPLSTVVIDFGMVRGVRVAPDAAGRFVAGTPGYIAPEQVLDPVELDPRADVYALAGTLYNVTTGRTFFDDLTNPRDRILAHMRKDPFEEVDRLRSFPAGVARVLRAATVRDPRDRPFPVDFGREFAACL